ncbi:N-acetyltransferase [Micromonospora sp. WMMD737]|uniref:N-acetyltransferase n=1 Tax=Micromonospora sp. WMMD737 TaxID=3404113 RepID=UPI003B95625C
MSVVDVVVRRATGDDIAFLSGVVADALAASPVGGWLVPDPVERSQVLRCYALLVLAHGVKYGQVDMTDDRTAVAVWYSRSQPTPVCAPYEFDLHRLFGPYAARFGLLHACADAVHPHTPHHYLAHLAVPSRRGAAARALLASYHGVLDAAGLPAYAEVSSHRPRTELLAQLGYLPRSPISLQPGGPVLWRMWRPPPVVRQPGGLPRRVRLHRGATPFHGRLIAAAVPRST